MTSFSASDVYQCPACAAFALRSNFRTLTFYRQREWTDGAPTQWWSSVNSPLVRCGSCRAIFWIEDIEPLGVLPSRPDDISCITRLIARMRGDPRGRLRAEQEWQALPAGWKVAQRIDNAEFDDIRYVLANPDGLTLERLICLRRKVWWALNDRFRCRSDGTPIPNVAAIPEDEERANKVALAALLKQGGEGHRDDADRGELLRQLGCFDEALAALATVPRDGADAGRAAQIVQLAKAGDVQMRALDDVGQ